MLGDDRRLEFERVVVVQVLTSPVCVGCSGRPRRGIYTTITDPLAVSHIADASERAGSPFTLRAVIGWKQ